MRFMTFIKSKESSSAGPPPASLFAALAQLGSEAGRAGALIDTGGLSPTALGARVRLEAGSISTSDGPFGGSQEVIGAYALFDVPSKEEAVEWARRFMAVHQEHWTGWEGETEVRQLLPAQPQAKGETPRA